MTQATLSVSGIGLITGLPIAATLEPLPVGSGIVFQVDDVVIPASPQYVVDSFRGITLGHQGKTLSIVEHFLAACAMVGCTDLRVSVSGGPELPLMDGSAADWTEFLMAHFKASIAEPVLQVLSQPVYYADPQSPETYILAVPSPVLRITYMMDLPHPSVQKRWWTWTPETGALVESVAPARTFGMVSELPALQARGLAKGVSLENTLGLTDEGGYTSPLRFDDEPMRHKVLDLIGDLMLCGVPVRGLNTHIIAACAGHTAHLAFGQMLAAALSGQS